MDFFYHRQYVIESYDGDVARDFESRGEDVVDD